MSSTEKLDILKNVLQFSHRLRDEHLFYCPYCNHHNPKMSVNVEKNVYKCWVCDTRGKDIWRVIRRFGDFADKRAWKSLSEEIDCSEQNIYDLLFGEKEQEEKETLTLPEEFVSLANKNLPISSRAPLSYLASRGIQKEDIIAWKIGYCSRGEFSNRVVFPSFDKDGNVNYFVARTYGDAWIKYRNPPSTRDIIFNELFVDWKDRIFLVEGIFDAINMGTNAVPILGSTMNESSKLFRKIIDNDTAVYIALDSDVEKKSLKIIQSLLQHGVEVYKVDTSGFSDVAEMPKKILDKRILDAKMITNEVFLNQKILSIGV